MTGGRLAPAKVNLFLHVGRRDTEGYHPLVSYMAFADVGDRLWLEPADRMSMRVQGPFAGGLPTGEDNLVMRAGRALLKAIGRADAPFRFVLDKRLPLAAGLGGGSADAGTALRLLDEALGARLPETTLEGIATSLGADGAACFRAVGVIAEGRGERLGAAPDWPCLPCVLVNPGVPSPTGEVYRAYDLGGRFSEVTPPALPERPGVKDAAAALAELRNDLEAPAVRLQPLIGEALAVLKAQPETLLGRMSGSGATCFAVCGTWDEAQRMAARLAAPGWWVQACRLG